MNYKAVLRIISKIILAEGLMLLLPSLTALIYGEKNALLAFLVTAIIAAALGGIPTFFLRKNKKNTIYAKEGFVIVAASWILLSAIGAVPFVISGDIPNYIDAFFETASGFTTTGASILDNVEALTKAALFWRSFTHWVGGMGVLVFIMALIPNFSDRSIHIMRAEMTGPVIGKLVPKAKESAKILYMMYFVLTAVEVVALKFSGMTFFDSLLHSFGTAGTGGFGLMNDSLGGYNAVSQWIITIFMFLFGINFSLYYLIILKDFTSIKKNTELRVYFIVVAAATLIITLNTRSFYGTIGETVRHATFQVSSFVTTTGYGTTDFNSWPALSKAILLLLMFSGGCAGSTAGGMKVSRAIMLFKATGREVKKMLHPKSINSVRMDGKTVEDKTISAVTVYFSGYMIAILLVFLLISVDNMPLETNFSAAVSCFNNIGPAFGISSFSAYSPFSKVVCSVAMIAGRLELFPLLIAVAPSTWNVNLRQLSRKKINKKDDEI